MITWNYGTARTELLYQIKQMISGSENMYQKWDLEFTEQNKNPKKKLIGGADPGRCSDGLNRMTAPENSDRMRGALARAKDNSFFLVQ
jgi:hypothetical protein